MDNYLSKQKGTSSRVLSPVDYSGNGRRVCPSFHQQYQALASRPRPRKRVSGNQEIASLEAKLDIMASGMMKLSRAFESIIGDHSDKESEGEKRKKSGSKKQVMAVESDKAGDKARSNDQTDQRRTGNPIEPDEVLGPDKRNMQQEQGKDGEAAKVGEGGKVVVGGKEIMVGKGTHQNPYLSTCVLPGPRNPAKVLDSR